MALVAPDGAGLADLVAAPAPAPTVAVAVVTGELAPVAHLAIAAPIIGPTPGEVLHPVVGPPSPPPPALPEAGASAAATPPPPRGPGQGYFIPGPYNDDQMRTWGYVRWQEATWDPAKVGLNLTENQVCSYIRSHNNPWVDPFLGAIVDLESKDAPRKCESPCWVGYGHDNYKCWTIEQGTGHGTPGNPVVGGPTPPGQPPGTPCDPGDPTCYGTGTPGGGGDGGGGGGGGGGGFLANIGQDIGQLLSYLGLGAGAASDQVTARAVLALVIAMAGLRDTVGGLPEGVATGLGTRFDDLGGRVGDVGGAVDGIVPALLGGLGEAFSPVFGPALGPLAAAALEGAGTLADRTATGHASTAAQFAYVMRPLIESLVAAVKEVLGPLLEPVEKVVHTLMSDALKVFTDRIERHGEVTPDNVYLLAGDVLTDAVIAGTAAQGSAALLELAHPLKNLGLAQFIGFIASFAGFDEIIKPYLAGTLHYALAVPARQHAAWKWQTELAPPERVKELAAMGILSLNAYGEVLRFAGLKPKFVAAELDDVYHHLRPAELVRAMDSSEVNPAWLVRKLRQNGVSPEDTTILERALELKSTKSGRDKLAGAAFDAFKLGQLDEAQLDEALTGADLGVTHRGYWLKAARLERRGQVMERVAAQVLKQYGNQLLARGATEQMLHALGFTPAAVHTQLLLADLALDAAQFKQEEHLLTAEIRQTQVQGQRDVVDQLKTGLVTADQAVSYLLSFGYSPAYAQAAVDVALLAPPKKPAPGAALVGTAALEATKQQIAGYVGQQVTLGQIDRLAALGILVELGLPTDLASIVVDVADALAGGPGGELELGIPGEASLTGGFAHIAQSILAGLQTRAPLRSVLDALFQALGIRGLARSELEGLVGDLARLLGRG